MTWVEQCARSLRQTVDPLRAGVFAAAVACDESGYAVSLSDGCPPDGRFGIGSVTKTMTGIALASLVTSEVVRLDSEIGQWLKAGDNAAITLGELATHTSGLPRLSPGHVLGTPNPYDFLTAQVAEEELRAARRQLPAEQEYSNFGFQVLGLALERAAKMPFGRLLEQTIFGPLGMARTEAGPGGNGTLLRGHKSGEAVEPWDHHLAGAGGVSASAHDMARYLFACLMPPATRLGQAIELAERPHYRIDPLRSAGLGWALGPPGYLGHDGRTAGFCAMLGIKASGRRAAAVFVNDQDARGLGGATRKALDYTPGG